jgi:hypothetical protein
MNYYEILFDNEYGVCIKGVRQPSTEEAQAFCQSDITKSGATAVISVDPIGIEDARAFYDMSNEEHFPIFGLIAE